MVKKIKNIHVGEHKKFTALPDTQKFEKDLLAAAKSDAGGGQEYNNENLPLVIQKLKTKLVTYQSRIYLEAQSYFTACNSSIISLKEKHDINVIKTQLEDKLLHSDTLDLPKEKAELVSDYQAFESERNNYNKFKKSNGLFQLPRNADPAETKFQLFALIALMIIEIIINLGMLKSGGGVSGIAGISISTAQVIFNVLSCYLLGKLLLGHILHAKTQLKKIVCSGIFAAHLFGILLININMGIYRQFLVTEADNFLSASPIGVSVPVTKTKELLDAFNWFPFPMPNLDPMSVIAIGVGLVFAFLAYWDGFKSDDSYPGYGSVYRGALKHKRIIGKRLRKINEGWNNCIKSFNAEMGKLGKEGTDSIQFWSHETNTIEQIWVDYNTLLETLQDAYDDSIDLYCSQYNQFTSGNKIKLKAELFKKIKYDLKKQFSDIAFLYLNDEQREKEEALKSDKFAKDFGALKIYLAEKNTMTSKEIKELTDAYSCNLD